MNNTQKYNITHNIGTLKIGTHNVRGFNSETKQHLFKTFYKINKLNIIGITETKLNKKSSKICMNNIQYYCSWWDGQKDHNYSSGVGLMVKNELAKHIVKIQKYKGHIITADMKFKGKQNIRFINTYIESNDADKEQRKVTIEHTIKLIKEALGNKYTIIVMGDFKADPDIYHKETKNKNSNNGKYALIDALINLNFLDAQNLVNNQPLDYTWSNNETT